MKNTTTTRRSVLATAGLATVGGLAGCIDQVAARTTNTGASPAAMFGGIRDDQLIPVTAGDTIRFSPTVRVEEQFLSGDIELEAWMTNAKVAPANDYNSVRSNKCCPPAVGRIPDEDDEDDESDEDDQTSNSTERLQRLTGASDDEIRGMYEYLEGEPVLGERCVITLPDARAPRGGPSIESLVTPNSLIEFVTGRADGEGTVYSWGSNEYETAVAEQEDDDDDDDDENESCTQHTGGLSTEQSVYCWGHTSTTAISGPTHTDGTLDALASDSGVVVVNVTNRPPTATDEKSMIGVTADGRPTDVDGLDDWGRESGPSSSTSTVVCQVLVQPAGCPCPFPALLHVQRHKNNDQYLYSCGWVIDESCLYEDSTTVLTGIGRGRGGGAGKASIQDINISRSGGVHGDDIRRVLPDDVSPAGSQMFSGRLDRAVRSGIIPDGELAEKVAQTVSSDGDVYCSCYPFDGHCLHLVDDGNTSNTVMFKAGAELSKSVN
ncbi:hypothetical protein [Natrarchaeobius versutus]|uniref:hypothetical protein n=1 Tax=Natrarchaeobius versutus TaxID=1679078 RepID=UPI003510CAE1